jgi:peptide deformylase
VSITQAGDPILRSVARSVAETDFRGAHLVSLLADLETELTAAGGVGLAAPQIGVGLQVARVHDPAELHDSIPVEVLTERERLAVDAYTMINPHFDPIGTDRRVFFEGCLSVPGYRAAVKRYRSLQLTYLDELGAEQNVQVTGWHARIVQHEIDHLNGVLYIDHMIKPSFMTEDHYATEWSLAPMREIVGAFDRP